MAVLVTAGHVDHGKSTLVRALTGIEPDRYAEERRRGMTLDLGFAWTTLPSGRDVAFVDVPGHARFVPTMLAGAGPVPAVVFVVAADGGWMPQSAEHLDALDAFGVKHGLLVVTRTDLADPAPSLQSACAALARTPLAGIPAVSVSAATGAGLPELRDALDALVSRLPPPLFDAPVRFWVDRSFTVSGSGTVVTGTLAAGVITVGDEFELVPSGRRVTVRGVQTTGRNIDRAAPVSRVALNVRGISTADIRRGDALVTPRAWTNSVDIDVRTDRVQRWPSRAVLHHGAAARPVRLRPLGADTVRLRIDTDLPWHVGDRGVLRDPGAHAVLSGFEVLDPAPPPLQRRGAAAARTKALAASGRPDLDDELRRRGVVSEAALARLGVPVGAAASLTPGWYVSDAQRDRWRRQLDEAVRAADDLAGGVALEELRRRLGVPDLRVLRALVTPPLEIDGPRVRMAGIGLPADLRRRLAQVLRPHQGQPWSAPEAADLAAADLGPRELAAAVRAGALERIADGVYLAVGATESAPGALRPLASPFTAAEAKAAWGTTRRVALPLLELLAARGLTLRTDDGRHRLR